MIIDGHEAVPRHAFLVMPVFGLAAFHARSQTKLVTFGHFLIFPSAFFLSVFVLLEIKRSAAMMAGVCDLVTPRFRKTS
jgi:hypothetical protein